MRITKEAIDELYPNTAYVIKNETVLEILDDTVVSYEDIVQKVAELDYQEEVKEYQRQRAAEYPSMADQQDMQFHDAINGTTTWKDAIQAVKDKYPKKKMSVKTLNKRKKDALAKLEASRES